VITSEHDLVARSIDDLGTFGRVETREDMRSHGDAQDDYGVLTNGSAILGSNNHKNDQDYTSGGNTTGLEKSR